MKLTALIFCTLLACIGVIRKIQTLWRKPTERMMTRIAIYARYSSDLQKPTSLEDQVRLCRHYIENGALGRESSPLIEVYTDAALSGRTLAHRVGMQRLLQDLQKGHFTAVVTEHVDRLARELADAAQIFKCIRASGAVHSTPPTAPRLWTRSISASEA